MLEILISSSVLILALAILRLALRGRISARLQYALWLLVALRLLVPVSLFHSPVSVAEAAAPAIRRVESYSARTPVYVVSNAVSPAAGTPASQQPDSSPVRHSWTVKDAARYVWYIGMAVTAVWFLLVNIRLARRLKKTRAPYEYSAMLPVYTAPGLPSPCLFGLLKPAVYLTAHAAGDGAQTTRIVTHELTHYRHGDMIWALLRSVCLVVWWFNPLVWLAAAISREDCELACDEGTIKALGEAARFDYGRTLVDMAAAGKGKASDLLCGATTMTGGDKSLRQRVTRIARAPKMSVSVAAIVLAIAAVAAGCAFTGAAKTESALETMPEQMILSIFYPEIDKGGDISTTVSDSQAIQEMYDLYLSLRDKAVLIDENYDMQYASPIYSVRFYYNEADLRSGNRMLGFQMWEGGQFLLYNDDASIYEEAGVQQVYFSKKYGALFEELYVKCSTGNLAPDTITDIHMTDVAVYANGEVMHLADGSELRLYDVAISPEDIFFSVEATYTGSPAPAISAVLTDGEIVNASATAAELLRDEAGRPVCYAQWGETLSLGEVACIACFGGVFGVNGFDVSYTNPPEVLGGYDREYWEEVERELGSFAEPADIDVLVSDSFDDTLPEDDIFGPMTIADYIYGTDSWRFKYNSDRIANDPFATIKVYDADGRVLWIMDDADALMIEEADGSVTWVWTGASGNFPPKDSWLDCADMIRHLLPWARGEYPTADAAE